MESLDSTYTLYVLVSRCASPTVAAVSVNVILQDTALRLISHKLVLMRFHTDVVPDSVVHNKSAKDHCLC